MEFRTGILIEEIMCDDMEYEEKKQFIEILTGKSFALSLLEFLGYRKIKQNKKSESRRPYSFLHDWGFIYSGFYQNYGIDLDNCSLSWNQFSNLFQGLRECTFTDVLGYRMIDLSEIKDKKQREHYKKMKQIYALPDNEAMSILEQFNKEVGDE